MKARPILFSAPMVRALLAGRKTQTRRIIKLRNWAGEIGERDDGSPWPWCEDVHAPGVDYWYPAPGGEVGDLMWVREMWTASPDGTIYRATADEAGMLEPGDSIRWRPSIFMPRRASRLTLQITDVRVQRLIDITPADAEAEGVERVGRDRWRDYLTMSEDDDWSIPKGSFASLWDSINGDGSWCANPWVWAYSFEVLRENVDAVLERGAA